LYTFVIANINKYKWKLLQSMTPKGFAII